MSAPAITRPLRAGVKEICDMKLSLWEVVDVQSVGKILPYVTSGSPSIISALNATSQNPGRTGELCVRAYDIYGGHHVCVGLCIPMSP